VELYDIKYYFALLILQHFRATETDMYKIQVKSINYMQQ